MDWLTTSLQWYVALLVMGLLFIPLTKKLFSSFFDIGYPFAKTIAIILISYSALFLGAIKILPFSQLSLFFLLVCFAALNCWLIKKHAITFTKREIVTLIGEELLFIISFLFLAYVRGQESSIHGLEKFMDFGFIQSILRTRFFPPADMWYTPEPINYYYFGHLTGAVLIKLTGIKSSIGYNLILATLFAEGVTLAFSICANISHALKKYLRPSIFIGLLGAFLVNLGGNLHTIYLFTKGYPNDNPIPFWQILSWYNPTKYWYPNATRFIPFTIHEFPSYSYVVADLHGHVFDIPFVMLTIALLFIFFTSVKQIRHSSFVISNSLLFGFLTAVHYMTNAFDGPIYMLLIFIFYFLVYKFSKPFVISAATTIISFIIFSLPFSFFFKPFVSGIGVNCAPSFLIPLQKFGPFLFEKDHCQISPFWMMSLLWGFFWISLLILLINVKKYLKNGTSIGNEKIFLLILLAFGVMLVFIPEFFYIKDIYPAHFRANTVFKLGYQAFIMGMIASSILFLILSSEESGVRKFILKCVYLVCFFFVFLYSFYAFPSYYGNLTKTPKLDGIQWLTVQYPEDAEIVNYLNRYIINQPVVLEAQGDSYTDYERISAMTGLPTVAGWWVHEWLWRGSSDVVGKRIPDIETLYQSPDIQRTKDLIRKYHISYIVVSGLERQKYKNIDEKKFEQIGKKVFTSQNGFGALYQVN